MGKTNEPLPVTNMKQGKLLQAVRQRDFDIVEGVLVKWVGDKTVQVRNGNTPVRVDMDRSGEVRKQHVRVISSAMTAYVPGGS